ncbi:MAG: TonB-dependent receptor domain-containing protein [Gemmatimonadales bacterium]
MRRASHRFIGALYLLLAGSFFSPAIVGGQAAPTGRIAGRVVDEGTARPLVSARVTILGQPVVLSTDLDGRYRSAPIPAGRYAIRVALIGYRPLQIDSVIVTDGGTAIVNASLTSAPLELEELVVEAAVSARAASTAGLLAQQQASAVVQDGISAETMARSPDSDASDAIARVTGISVIGKKYVVVRGLGERYSGTMLNGAELASPEPLRKVVPLDVFPASLLESIVTTKGATPDKPGDFAGGLVEIKTKEFPEEFVAQFKLSQEWNSVWTFEKAALIPRGGTDFAGIDDGRRAMPALPSDTTRESLERFAERFRNVWTPSRRRIAPGLGFGFNVGGQVAIGEVPVGAVFSVNYSSKAERQPARIYQFSFGGDEASAGSVFDEAQTVTDWGSILNLSTRIGTYHKLAFNNFYSRNAEEGVFQSSGFDIQGNADRLQRYQVRYIERDLLQSQLAGEHFFPALRDSRLDWKATVGVANRDEPDNRIATYGLQQNGAFALFPNQGNEANFRFLDDRTKAGQLDWSLPLSLRTRGDALIKVGAAARMKNRSFQTFRYQLVSVNQPPDGVGVRQLPPEQAFAPENLGRNIEIRDGSGLGQPYEADDDLYAGYAMVDLPLLARLRVVGGVRYENWRLNLFSNTRAAPDGEPIIRRDRDILWSANLTASLSDRMNFRLAAARTVNRPDPREVSNDQYVAVGGECDFKGNPALRRARIVNADARWELYPGPGEIIAVSGFYKRFDDPIVEVVGAPASSGCLNSFANAERATNVGGELEIRKQLGFLPGFLSGLSIGGNLTVVESRVTPGAGLFGAEGEELTLVGQSPWLVNGNLTYVDAGGRFDASVLVNYFADRSLRYGLRLGGIQTPNVIERGRATVDAKVQKGFGQFNVSLSARNLTGANARNIQQGTTTSVLTGFSRLGTTISIGVGYDF